MDVKSQKWMTEVSECLETFLDGIVSLISSTIGEGLLTLLKFEEFFSLRWRFLCIKMEFEQNVCDEII